MFTRPYVENQDCYGEHTRACARARTHYILPYLFQVATLTQTWKLT